MPCLRHTSTVFAPASCSRRIAIICSSLNRLRFIVRPPLGGRTLLKSEGVSGAHVENGPLHLPRLPRSGFVQDPVPEDQAVETDNRNRRLLLKASFLREGIG